jgi:hypothetical protein
MTEDKETTRGFILRNNKRMLASFETAGDLELPNKIAIIIGANDTGDDIALATVIDRRLPKHLILKLLRSALEEIEAKGDALNETEAHA